MRFDIITIFPGFFVSPLEYGIWRRAQDTGRVSVHAHDLRSFTADRHRTVDDRPFGGGEGMVLKPRPIYDALLSLNPSAKEEREASRESVILLSAQGVPFTQRVAHELTQMERVVLICGRYEGVDERVNEMFCDREISIGDYVLSGGELAAAVILDAVIRLLPGVLGNADSARFESFGAFKPAVTSTPGSPPPSTSAAGGLLDYPHYTRPAEFLGRSIPKALLGGDHEAIRRWRRRMALSKTLRNRPDLLAAAQLSEEDLRTLEELRRDEVAQKAGI